MDSNSTAPGISQLQPVAFPEGKQAKLLSVPKDGDPQRILRTLGIQPPQAVIVISGGAGNMDPQQVRRLAPFFSLGVARAAKKRQALIIDGGTQAGVMELTGLGVADQGYESELLGVAPSGKVSYPGAAVGESDHDRAALDPNHSHFVLVEGQSWGDETALMYGLADALRQGFVESADSTGEHTQLPVVTVLAGGRINGIALREAQATVRKGWPLVVIAGSGQLADEVARRFRSQRQRSGLRGAWSRLGIITRRWLRADLQQADAFLTEIVEEGQIVLFPMRSKPSDLDKLLVEQLKVRLPESILLRSWRRFALYDLNAARHQKVYRILKTWPLILGVLATALVLVSEFLSNPPVTAPPPFDRPFIQPGEFWFQLLHLLIVLTPIVVALFLAADRLFKSGNKWLLLRYYAEEIKKDIYSYRTLSALQRRQETDLPDEAAELAARLASLSRRLMRTEVNESALKPYSGPIPPAMYGAAAGDDGISPMGAEDYLNIRINDQLSFYSSKANRLERQLQPRQWLILIFGAIGSLLAALGGAFQFWVPLSVAVVSALTAFLEYQQVEQTIVKYNQAMTKLANLSDWWVALSDKDKQSPQNILRLVEDAEQVMQSEHLGWVQQMQVAQAGAGKADSSQDKQEAEGNPGQPGAGEGAAGRQD